MQTSPVSIRTLLVEDEAPMRRYLREMLAGEQEIVVVGEAASGCEAVRQIWALSPDLVFLDVQMPELDGFGVISKIGVKNMPACIFVTGYGEYAIRAFEVEAIDYLCKPFDRDRLLASLERAIRHLRLRAERSLEAGASHPISCITAQEGDGIIFIPVEKIRRIEAADKYVVIHAAEHVYTARHTMQALEGMLDPKQFIRIHRSILVNRAVVRGLHPLFHGDYIVKLTDGTELRLSRNFRESFFAQMGC